MLLPRAILELVAKAALDVPKHVLMELVVVKSKGGAPSSRFHL